MEKQSLPPQGSDETTNVTSQPANRSMSRRSLVRATLLTGAVVAPVGAFVALNGQRMSAAPRLASSTALTDVAPKKVSQAAKDLFGSASAAGQQFVEIQNDENQHVSFLQQALGSNARLSRHSRVLLRQTSRRSSPTHGHLRMSVWERTSWRRRPSQAKTT